MRSPLLLIVAALSLSATTLRAQDVIFHDWPMGQPIMAPQQHWSLMDDKDFSEDDVDADQMAALFIFTPSPERRAANLDSYFATLRETDPASAGIIEAQFAANDVLGDIGTAMEEVGLYPYSVADAYAVWMINAWCAAHGVLDQTSPQAAMAVADQMREFLMESPDLLTADDAVKQEMAEGLLIQAALIAASQQRYANDPAEIAALAQIVRQSAAAQGFDLDQFKLTEEGFVLTGN